MPFKKGTSKKTVQANFHEFRHGKTYAKTKRKYGKKTAQKQMVAAVLSEKRRSKKKKR